MKRAILGITALLAVIAGPATAADMPMRAPPPIMAPLFTWTGFYIGVNGGYGGDRFRHDFAVLGAPGSTHITSGGGFGGGQIGYNYQFGGGWVLGIEGDIQASDINGEVSATFGGVTASAGTKIDWFATARGRLGYGWDRVLFYATGGYAYAAVDNTASLAVIGVPALVLLGSTNTDHNGWVAGGGIEYAFTNNLTVKTEYQYLDFERKTIAGAGATFIDVKPTAHTVRGGVNWKF